MPMSRQRNQTDSVQATSHTLGTRVGPWRKEAEAPQWWRDKKRRIHGLTQEANQSNNRALQRPARTAPQGDEVRQQRQIFSFAAPWRSGLTSVSWRR